MTTPRKTLKEYAEAAAGRLKRLKSGSSPVKEEEKKSSKPVPKGKEKKNTKKT